MLPAREDGLHLRYVTLDVFTADAFTGNPLAVVLDARGLDGAQMLAIAREFNFSETTFVLPSRRPDAVRRVRIFTPGGELPFAGHPTVGTAVALVAEGHVAAADDVVELAFDLDAGLTPVTVRRDADGRRVATFTAPERPEVGVETPPELVAAALGLPVAAIDTRAHRPVDIGTGVDFVAVRLRDRAALDRAAPDLGAWAKLESPAARHGVVVYVPGATAGELDVRMFAPGVGVLEDPATGSAAAALGGLLALLDPRADARLAWSISQGVALGRPSRLDVAVDKAGGLVRAIRVTGAAVLVMEGTLHLPPAGPEVHR